MPAIKFQRESELGKNITKVPEVVLSAKHMADKSASKMPNMKFSNRFQSNTMGETYIIRTGGIKPFVHPVMAQITLLSDPLLSNQM